MGRFSNLRGTVFSRWIGLASVPVAKAAVDAMIAEDDAWTRLRVVCGGTVPDHICDEVSARWAHAQRHDPQFPRPNRSKAQVVDDVYRDVIAGTIPMEAP